jgi:hypothetical protein
MSLKKLKDAIDIQCSHGNWNYDNYMHGMANGMLFALSVIEGSDCVYLDAPDKWLANHETENRDPVREFQDEPVCDCESDGGPEATMEPRFVGEIISIRPTRISFEVEAIVED